MNFKLNLHYINLAKRPERNELFLKNWQTHGNCHRVDAFDLSEQKQGTLGCYLSHKKAFETILTLTQQETRNPQPTTINIICEDDAVPCSDFTHRLQTVMQQLPNNWDVLMLGYSTSKNSQHAEVSELIHKANKFILAGHCYMVNPNFYQTLNALHNRQLKPFDNFDLMLNYLQQNHNVYMAIPAMAYQYSSFSDNSNRVVGNTSMTETYFKDKL